MPNECVSAQSIVQLVRPGQSLKNMKTAPRSRVVLRVQRALSATSVAHGSE